MTADTSRTTKLPPFQLLWTVGFSGKRYLTDTEEIAVRNALNKVIEELILASSQQNARLTAISSLARGGDVIFAEVVQAVDLGGGPLPWKGLLPFAWEPFLHQDLNQDATGRPLSEEERAQRRERAGFCRDRSLPPAEVVSCGAHPIGAVERDECFLECGYRTVDESDVMILLLRQHEYQQLARLATEPDAPPSTTRGVGAFAVGCYALASGRPLVILDADAANVAASVAWLGGGKAEPGPREWFMDPVVSAVVKAAGEVRTDHEEVRCEMVGQLSGPTTPNRESVALVGAQLGALANRHQGRTQSGLLWVLRCHLGASALAAVGATIFHLSDPLGQPLVFLLPLALLGLMKPGLAFSAWSLERRLHRDGRRETWLNARVLAELCRGALNTWPLPLQPLDAQDEEDFPRVKRLIRTLRLLREQDTQAGVRGTVPQAGEPPLDADMRAACAFYRTERLLDQAGYYHDKLGQAQRQERRWRRDFQVATWTAIVVGVGLLAERSAWLAGWHLLGGLAERWFEAVIIIAPFVAAHCLGILSLLDARRRCRRYGELRDFLLGLARTLERTHANPSRLRLIEQAERTLIEEQHEWFSVMRNLNV